VHPSAQAIALTDGGEPVGRPFTQQEIDPMPDKRSRILVVEDHPIVRSALVGMMNEQPDMEVCGEASEANEALKAIDTTRPDLITIDLVLKGGSGLELVKQIRARNSQVRILVASMYDESLFAERLLRAGANGYLHKDEPTQVILGAIRHVLAGGTYLSDTIASRLLNSLVQSSDTHPPATGLALLSDRELEVYTLIGRGLTAREIADHLCLSVKTVETYRGHIKHKLGIESINELAVQAARWVLNDAQATLAAV
jgi:DNA-binding NarL/FixJ family response regulator